MNAPHLEQIGINGGRRLLTGRPLIEEQPADPRAHNEEVLRGAARLLWRKRGIIALSVAVCLTLATLILLTSQKQYTAEASVRVNFGSGSASNPARIQMDAAAMIDGETKILRSRAVADRVVARWHLDQIPAFAAGPGLVSRVLGSLSEPAPRDDLPTGDAGADTASRSAAFLRATATVMANTTVVSDNRSYIIGIRYRWTSAETAARIATTLAQEYLRERQEQGLAAARGRQVAEVVQLSQRFGERHPALQAANARLAEIDGEIVAAAKAAPAQAVTLDSFAAEIALPAEKPLVPSSPKPAVVLGLALLLGLVGSSAAILLIERFSIGLSNERAASDKLGLRCLGTVPAEAPDHPHNNAMIREAVRAIGVAAALDVRSSTCTVVLITSSGPNEGKSLLASTLASIMAQSGRRVLMVDAVPDPTRPNRSREKWTADAGGSYRVVKLGDGDLSGGAVEHLVMLARNEHDVVLIKAPPVLILSDAVRLARLADMVMLLAHWRKTPAAIVASAARRLRDAGITVSGLVLTNVDLYHYGAEQLGGVGHFLARYHGSHTSIAPPEQASASAK
uniref:Lipopolysaccharide biosynthesis n=1 Tax=Rhodopseudomonas palustris (strain BisA53) TaxID=316055 RepID=Q07KV6_RHOP5